MAILPSERYLERARNNPSFGSYYPVPRCQNATSIFKGHSCGLESVAWLSLSTFVTGSHDHTLKIWNVTTTECEQTLLPNNLTQAVYHVAASQDGRFICSGSSGTTKNCLLWDVANGSVTRVFEGHTSPVYHTTFSRSGFQIMASAKDGSIRLYCTTSSKPVSSHKCHTDVVECSSFCGGLPTISETVPSFSSTASMSGNLTNISTAPDNSDFVFAASASRDGSVILIDWRVRKPIFQLLDVHGGLPVNSIVMITRYDLITGGSDYLCKRFDLRQINGTNPETSSNDGDNSMITKGRINPVRVYAGHSSSVRGIDVSPDGKLLASGADDGGIRLWTLDDYEDLGMWKLSISDRLLSYEKKISEELKKGVKSGWENSHIMKDLHKKTKNLKTEEERLIKCLQMRRTDATGVEELEADLTLSGHKDRVTRVQWKPFILNPSKQSTQANKSFQLLSSSWDQTALLWNLSS